MLLIIIILGTTIHIKQNSLYDQQAGARWSEDREMEQMSIIYPVTQTSIVDDFFFESLSHQIQDAIDKSAFANESGIPDEKGITFPYSVCVQGKITIANGDKRVDTNTIGVDKHFFTFHPVNLLYGSYIASDELMKDGIVIDDEIAWKLFGSSDVVGKMVTISDVPHYVKGVVHKDEGRIAEAAGLASSIAYVSIDTLRQYGMTHGSYVYELILPNPVEDFASNLVKDTLGTSLENLEFVDNSTRFSSKKSLDILANYGVRSMSSKDIIYPYFENEARAWEDILAIYTCLLYAMGIALAIIVIIKLWLFKTRAAKRRNYEKKKNRYVASVRTAISRWMRKKERE